MSEINLKFCPVLYFFRAGEAFAWRESQRQLTERRMESRVVVQSLRRARRSWRQPSMQLLAAEEQIMEQQDAVGLMEEALWQAGQRLEMAQEQVASLDTLVRLMLEGPEGLALGETYVKLRWQRMQAERADALRKAEETARVLTAEERARDAALTRKMASFSSIAQGVAGVAAV